MYQLFKIGISELNKDLNISVQTFNKLLILNFI